MDLSWITEFGIPGLVVLALVVMFGIFGKWILPNVKVINGKLAQAISKNHQDTLNLIRMNSSRIDTLQNALIRKMDDVEGKIAQIIDNDFNQETRLNSIEITQSKNCIYSEELPYAERVWSAHRYIRLGGNGHVKNYINTAFREIDPETFESVWALADQAVGKVERS